MEEPKMAKDLPINPRIVEQLAKTTVKTSVDGIVELITNCDDSYRRLGEEEEVFSGEIEIYVDRKKGGICENLKVKDYAQGMTKEELQEAIVYASETSGFEKGKSVRGLFGRGLKETIIALGEGEIKTIKNGKECKTKLWFDKKIKKPRYDDELLEDVRDTSEKHGTEIKINITNQKIKIPECEKFRDQISRHYALRDINSSKYREITLVFDDLKRKARSTIPIIFSYPEAKKVKEEDVSLPGYGDKVKILIYESQKPLDSPRHDAFGLAGILIKTRSAILENQLFKFENEPAALYFFGEAICEGLEERLRRGETEIIDPNRGGLEWQHEYCQALSNAIERVLEPLVLEKREVLEKKPRKEVKGATKKLLKKLCSELNKLANEELEETIEISEPEPNITNLIIKPETANIQTDKPRAFSVYAPDNLVKDEGQVVHIKSDTIDIQPLASTVNLEKYSKYPEKIWYRYFKVVGKSEGAEGNIVVKLGAETAQAKVKVAPPRKRETGEITGRKRGFISDIVPDELENPPQRVVYGNGIIKIYIKFPSIARFIKSGLEGVESPEGKMLLGELVGDAFCRELVKRKREQGDLLFVPGAEIEGFNTKLNEYQKKYLHLLQDIIFAWKFKE